MLRRAAAVLAASALVTGCGSAGPAPSSPVERFTVSFQSLPGRPFGVIATGQYAFVDLRSGRLLVLSTTGPHPPVVRSIRIPGRALGISLTRNGLLVADFASDQLETVDVAGTR